GGGDLGVIFTGTERVPAAEHDAGFVDDHAADPRIVAGRSACAFRLFDGDGHPGSVIGRPHDDPLWIDVPFVNAEAHRCLRRRCGFVYSPTLAWAPTSLRKVTRSNQGGGLARPK